MTVIINGEKKEIDDSLNLLEVVQLFSQHNQAIIVELNGIIIKKDKSSDITLKEGDIVELIQMVGGG